MNSRHREIARTLTATGWVFILAIMLITACALIFGCHSEEEYIESMVVPEVPASEEPEEEPVEPEEPEEEPVEPEEPEEEPVEPEEPEPGLDPEPPISTLAGTSGEEVPDACPADGGSSEQAEGEVQALGLATDSYKVVDIDEKIVRGRLEYGNGQGVCDDYFTDYDAAVACDELGYQRREARALTELHSPGNDHFRLDDLLCDGRETSLGACGRADNGDDGDHNCSDNEHAGVVCYTEVAIPKAPEINAASDPEDEGATALSWTAPKTEFTCHDIGYIESIVDNYELQLSEDGDSGWADVSTGIPPARRTYRHRGLSRGTWYYRLRAVNTAGDGPYSNVVEVYR